jgi:two-component system sensor histidine kinase/response regulator
VIPPNLRILIAEDDDPNAEVARSIFRKLGIDVDVAWNGAQAVEFFRDKPYNLIFMDVQMPIMDGLEATVRIRALPRGGETPIIGTSAGVDKSVCLAVGMNDVMPKPFQVDKVQAVLELWVG